MKQREIKFRAWDKEDKKMYFDVQGMYDSEPTWYGGFGEIIENDRFVVMQYTGLRDKNGKEIYEGDIVKTGGVVKFGEAWSKADDDYGWNGWYIDYGDGGPNGHPSQFEEVIGNIYENPELLRKELGAV